MDTSNKVLSQAEIDAMIAGRNLEPPPAAATLERGNVIRDTAAPVSAARAQDVSPATQGKLAECMSMMEATAKRLEQLEKAYAEACAAIAQLQQGLQATPAYGVHKTFTCKSCEGHGFVAIQVKCTQCGQMTWWGWHPPRK